MKRGVVNCFFGGLSFFLVCVVFFFTGASLDEKLAMVGLSVLAGICAGYIQDLFLQGKPDLENIEAIIVACFLNSGCIIIPLIIQAFIMRGAGQFTDAFSLILTCVSIGNAFLTQPISAAVGTLLYENKEENPIQQ